MNTIKERAIDAAQNFTYTELDAGTIIEEHTHGEYNAYKQGFYDGAIDQRKIDIDKACKWLNAHADDYIFEQYDIIGMEDNFVADFRKAMED